jgi:bifunctional non-homologous end joining protein LigD
MTLVKYKDKRNFRNTPEPAPKQIRKKSARSFVVQRHDASHLHYDFRLEVGGVLKSWAVPKGPSMNPSDKRLAVMVEDHPLLYGKFEGEIPKGNYGAGSVKIWDHGTFEPVEGEADDKSIEKKLKDGSFKFFLHGKKLNGSFALVQMKGGKGNNWLLIKHKDEHALDDHYDVESVSSEELPAQKKEKIKTKEKGSE